MEAKRRILVDMDGVIADFEKGFLDAWRAKHPSEDYIPLDQRTTFYPSGQYPSRLKKKVKQIPLEKGFFLDLSPISGSQEALEELARVGEVFICTSPMTKNPYCASEKLLWLEKHFGPEWKRRDVITKDKTLVRASILIDDRPTIQGVETPSWEHVHYAQPYNRGLSNKRLSWQNYREVLKI